MDYKFSIYEEAVFRNIGLCIIPIKYSIFCFAKQNFIGLKPATEGEIISSRTFPELSFSTDDIFGNL